MTTMRLVGTVLGLCLIGAAPIAPALAQAPAQPPVQAQAPAPTPAYPEPVRGARGTVLLPGVMTGPGTFGTAGMRRLCDPRSVGLTQWRVTWVERIIKPTAAQQKPLEDLKTASTKAIDLFATACPRRAPRLQTADAQLAMMEKRLDTAMQAIRLVRPAFDTFYASLDPGQKAKVDELGPKRSGWLW
ncbi:MAG: Spy/CpxP family protein refolding chaperone [Rhodoplanes sp.]|uniref:Spy/CpxP family protein refolding chaperone n=1 Tax=Rhodoplanes sp. TaxID=1968906 RepID=UPI001800DA5C|nr:Spy/CpxP family protein refolding chaperone [Rhodoplanes sp.]NVO13495.1 Spy/CpxP family protein refolding chaperone [Rhodoplanes sp.]